jgi:hypothetical protein
VNPIWSELLENLLSFPINIKSLSVHERMNKLTNGSMSVGLYKWGCFGGSGGVIIVLGAFKVATGREDETLSLCFWIY